MNFAPPPHDPLLAITRTVNPVRRIFHLLLALAGWLVFVLFLYRVFFQPIDGDTLPTFLLLLAIAAAIALLDFFWIRFNLHIHRTRQPRTRVTQREYTAAEDILGRPLEGADWTRLREAPYIRIDLAEEGQVKLYRTPSPAGASPGEAGGGREEKPWTG